MKHYSRDAFAISFLVASVLLATWLGISGPLIADASKQPYQWFKDFQPLVGAAFAGIGLYIAWRNVSRQLDQQRVSTRLTLLSREEDRIESELPGLREASLFCDQIAKKILLLSDMNRIADHLRTMGVRNPEQLRDFVNTRLPETDDRTRRILIADIRKLIKQVLTAQIVNNARFNRPFGTAIDPAPHTYHETQLAEVKRTAAKIHAFGHDIKSEIKRKMERLPRIRAEIEAKME
jgi:hypothetical protein